MNRILLLLYISCLAVAPLLSQELNFKSVRPQKKVKDSILSKVEHYKIISHRQDTTYIDTTLTIMRAYKHNSLGKDLFGRQAMSNEGSPLQALTFFSSKTTTSPSLGITANAPYLLQREDLPYYYLPSPITEFHFKTAMEQGQMLHSLFSANITPELNFFIQYRALRSDGDYQRSYNNFGRFAIGGGYASKNKKYWASGYFSFQDLEREESGGLLNLEQFTSGEAQFLNRLNLDVKLPRARSYHLHRAAFFQQAYSLSRASAAVNTKVQLKHTIDHTLENYVFEEEPSTGLAIAPTYVQGHTFNETNLRSLTNRFGMELILHYLGQSFIYAKAYNYHYWHDRILIRENGKVEPHQLKGTDYGLGLHWKKKYKGLSLAVEGEQMILGKLLGSLLNAQVGFALEEQMQITAGTTISAVMPDFQKLLFLSNYKPYQWNNVSHYQLEQQQKLWAELITPWVELSGELTNRWNHTAFLSKESDDMALPLPIPYQHTAALQYYKLQAKKHFQARHWGIDNTFLVQGLSGEAGILNLPTFVTRNTLYYQGYWFKRAMQVQSGVSLNYFSRYYADHYQPVLGTWITQNATSLGNYPNLDYFFHAKVRTMRIYLSWENIGAAFWGRRYFSAPTYPYRDMSFRLGISWNFFS